MKRAEQVTFAGGGVDRAAELRSEAVNLAEEADHIVLMWRGKPMLYDDRLVRVASDHAILEDASPERVLLGRDGADLVFAADLSAWTPPDLNEDDVNTFLDATLQRHPCLPDTHVFTELRTAMTRLSRTDAEFAAIARSIFNWHRTHRFCAACGAESTFAMGGYQRNCGACGVHHFPRTDPVVIMLITHGNKVLVGRSPGWPTGMYSLLAGFIEPGETMEAAVRREVAEETGIKVAEVGYLASQPWPFPASLMLGCWGRAVTTQITIDPQELDDAMWVSREDMAAAYAGDNPDLLPARKGAIAHFLIKNWLSDTLD